MNIMLLIIALILFVFLVSLAVITFMIFRKLTSIGAKLALGCGALLFALFACGMVGAFIFSYFMKSDIEQTQRDSASGVQVPDPSSATQKVYIPPVSTPLSTTQTVAPTLHNNITPMSTIENDLFFMQADQATKQHNEKAFMKAASKARQRALSQPNSFVAQMVFGRIMLLPQNSPNSNILAERHIRKAYEIEPANTEAAKFLVGASYKMKNYSTVIELMEPLAMKGQALEPMLVKCLNDAYYYGREHQRGLDFWAELLQRYPDNVSVRMQYALLAKYTGHTQMAITELQRVVNNPNCNAASRHKAQEWIKNFK